MNRSINRMTILLTAGILLGLASLSPLQAGTISHNKSAGVHVNNPPTLIVDDFDNGVPPNKLGGGWGSFQGPGAVSTATIVTQGALGGNGCSVRLDYNISNANTFCGYWTQFRMTPDTSTIVTRNLETYTNLSFYVKGATGGEFFKVEISTWAGARKASVYINDYVPGNTVTTDWQKVVIPLDAFANIRDYTHGITYNDWKNIWELTFTLENSASSLNGGPLTGSVYFDMITLGSEDQQQVILDSYSDKLSMNAVGGEMGTARSTYASSKFIFVSTEYVTAPSCVEWIYSVGAEHYQYGALFSIVGGGETKWENVPHDFSDYDRISFYIKARNADENPGQLMIELPQYSGAVSTYIVSGITTDWKQFIIPFSAFSPMLYPEAIMQWTFTESYDIAQNPWKLGRLYIDDVRLLSSGYVADTTPPATPSSLKLMDTAAGQALGSGTNVSWVNWLQAQAGTRFTDTTLSSVRFEYRYGGSGWTTIGTDYDLSDAYYSAYWDTSDIPDNQACEVRVVARDSSGNESSAQVSNVIVRHYPNVSALTDDQVLDLIQKQVFWYYWAETNPSKGFIQDRAKNFMHDTYGYTSVASAGYGLAAICVAHQRGWISFDDAYSRVCGILKAYFDAPESSRPDDSSIVRHNGFYYHYTNFGGARSGNSELSTIDTSLFIAGALYAGQYFNELGYTTPRDFAQQLYERVDWVWMAGGNPSNKLYWGWMPVAGNPAGTFNQGVMGGYSECVLSYILAAGAPNPARRLNSTGWNTLARPVVTYRGLSYVFEKSLFTHQYPGLFLDLSGKYDRFCGYASNTFSATIHHHRYAYDNRSSYATYTSESWGLGGTDMPMNGYKAYGIGTLGTDNDGTVALSNLFTAFPERPEQVMYSFRNLYASGGTRLWGKYGFTDSYNTDASVAGYFNDTGMWKDPDVLGVQQGAVLLAIENYRTGNIREKIAAWSYINNAFSALGFTTDAVPPAAITTLQATYTLNTARLSWTAAGNDGYDAYVSSAIYEIRFAMNSTDTWDTAPMNYLNYNIIFSSNVSAGSAQSFSLPGLSGNTTYYFWIKMADTACNWSPLSNRATLYIPVDYTPPATVNDLSAQASAGLVRLIWTAPGDDGSIGPIFGGYYEVRYSTVSSHTSANAPYSLLWSTNTNPGASESMVITALVPERTHYFWIRTSDEQGTNWGSFSSRVSFAVTDPVPPAAITNLAASIDYQLKLTWTAPGDNGTSGTATAYQVRYSTMANILSEPEWNNASVLTQNWTPTAPGNRETKVLTGLNTLHTYWFAIRAVDDVGNKGGLNNASGNSAAPGYYVKAQTINALAGAPAFGDFDNDGDLDLALGRSVYRNNSGVFLSFFTASEPAFGYEWQGTGAGQVRWADFDNDGYLDFVAAPVAQGVKVYRNNSGTGFALLTTLCSLDNYQSGLDVGDYNNDGYVDILVSGWASGETTKLFKNMKGSFTEVTDHGLPGKQFSDVAFGDYDNDGYLDVSLCGAIYHNTTTGTFTASGFGGFRTTPALAWGDYNNDGNLDLAIGANDPSHLLPNNGNGTFGTTLLTPAGGHLSAFGDYNNDGRPDVILGSKLYTNMGGSTLYEKQALPYDPAYADLGRRCVMGDIDNDGALDLVVSTGIYRSNPNGGGGFDTITEIYRNVAADVGVVNAAPQPPSSSLVATLHSSSITFTWADGLDAETPTAGLSYALRVGTKPYTAPGDDTIVNGSFGSPLNGSHARLGSAHLGFTLTNISFPEGTTYYWSIRAIDAGFRKSDWSTQQSTYRPVVPPSAITTLTATDAGSGDTAILRWTATGNDGLAGSITGGTYHIKYSSVSSHVWDTMPYQITWSTNTVPAQQESRAITSLLPLTSWYFSIRLADDSDIWSALGGKTTCYLRTDSIAPSAVANLSADRTGIASEGQIRLLWSAPGDDGSSGTLTGQFAIQYASYTAVWQRTSAQIVISTADVTPGSIQSRVVTGLINGSTYYFRLWTADQFSNWSGVSNGATTWAMLDTVAPASIADLSALVADASGSVKLSWTAPGDNGSAGVLPSGSKFAIQYASYTVTWSTSAAQVVISTSSVAPGDAQSRIVTGLLAGATYHFRIWTADEKQNWSVASGDAACRARQWILWDNCDSHFWWGADWGYYAPETSWGTFMGRQCMRARWPQADAWAGTVRTDWVFPTENWETSVTGIKADIYGETDWGSGLNVKLQVRTTNFDTAIQDIQISNLNTRQWNNDCTWSFNTSLDFSQVAALSFFFDGLANKPATCYIDNIRLVTAGGDVAWDSMDKPFTWLYGGDAYNWNTATANGKEPISHNQTTTESPAGALYLRWDSTVSGDTFAKLESRDNVNANLSSYRSMSADVYCSQTNAKIKIDFWDGANYLSSTERYVSQANTWQKLYWNLPDGAMSWASVQKIIYKIDSTDISTQGELYIDNVKFSDIQVNP